MKYLNPYRIAVDTKNLFYDKGWLKPAYYQVPVISVGNLTTGGTGKTPIVLELISILKGKSILVVSKSYKADLPQPAEVTLENLKHTFMYGDEPCLIKKMAPHAHVWSGPNKSDTAEFALDYYALNKVKIDVVIVDDGFSHRALKRHLDIVLIDVSQPMSHYKLLPLGHLREDLKQVFRSQLVIFTKTNNANADTLKFFQNYLAKKKHPVISSQAFSNVDASVKKLFIYSAIGNPDQLIKNLKTSGFEVVKHLEFSDHHKFSTSEQKDILQQWQTEFKDCTLCATEKDLVKVSNPELREKTKAIQLKIEFTAQDKDLLHAKISQTI